MGGSYSPTGTVGTKAVTHLWAEAVSQAQAQAPSDTIFAMFHVRSFSLNFAAPAGLAACARAITLKTTTIKG